MTITIKKHDKVYNRDLAARIDLRSSANTVIAEWAAKPASVGLTKNTVQNTKVNAICFAFNTYGEKFSMCSIVSGKHYKNTCTVLTKMDEIVRAVVEDTDLTGKHAFDTTGDAEAAEDDTKSTFSIEFSCETETPKDTFRHTFSNQKTTLSGFAQTATVTKIEAWADTKEVLA